MILDDAANFLADRNHARACEVQQIDNGAMDQYVTGATTPECTGSALCCEGVPSCSAARNWAMATGATPTDAVADYWSLADDNAIADRYFQPSTGGTASNNMYFAGARFRSSDNAKMPDVQVGAEPGDPYGMCLDSKLHCITTDRTRPSYSGDIASLLMANGDTFSMYADGYDEAYQARENAVCADANSVSECPYDCLTHPIACHGCLYDPSDIPFLYFQTFADSATDGGVSPTPYIKDFSALPRDLANGALPNVAFVKARLFHNEHPNFSTISDGARFVHSTVEMIEASPYASSTLILITWDEGGGFFDHVPPPAAWPTNVDQDDSGNQVPYGTRVPLLAVGRFVAKGTVSHVLMEHSSIVKFLEYNFLGRDKVGLLGARDSKVNNLGGLLDSTATVITVPVN